MSRFYLRVLAIVLVCGIIASPALAAFDFVFSNDGETSRQRTLPQVEKPQNDAPQNLPVVMATPTQNSSFEAPEATPNGQADVFTPATQQPLTNRPSRSHNTQRERYWPRADRVKVGLLAPLTGPHAELGQNLLRMAEMATFDIAPHYFELLVGDTGQSTQQAQNAARQLVDEGAQLIIGPVFSQNTQAVKYIARRRNVPILSLSTDWRVAGNNTYLMGFLPFHQVRTIAYHALQQEHQRFAIIHGGDEYGRVVAQTLEQVLRQNGLPAPMVVALGASAEVNEEAIQELSQFAQRREQAMANWRARNPGIADNRASERDLRYPAPPFDALLLPIAGPELSQTLSLLTQYRIETNKVQFLGTGLWDGNPAIMRENLLRGAWFVSPDPQRRADTFARFETLYGRTPPRIASLAYDAVALASVLAQRGFEQIQHNQRLANAWPRITLYDRQHLTQQVGFSGIDGLFRLHEDGLIERSLAVMAIDRGQIQIIRPDADRFIGGSRLR